jgi:lipopolysaccharide transport system ATP-binding protein
VRLAFAVAAHLNPEILIVDEVLAVGDAQFQKKCLGKMQDVAQQEGRTVLFVSHNMQSVSVLCSKAIFLQGGQVTFDGSVEGAIDLYLKSYAAPEQNALLPDRRPGSGEYRYTDVRPVKPLFGSAEPKQIDYRIERRKPMGLGRLYLSAHIVNERDVVVAQFDSRLLGFWLDDAEVLEGALKFTSPWLKPGLYRVDLGVCSTNALADLYEGACTFEVSPILPYSHSVADNATSYGVVFGDFEWTADNARVLAGTRR